MTTQHTVAQNKSHAALPALEDNIYKLHNLKAPGQGGGQGGEGRSNSCALGDGQGLQKRMSWVVKACLRV